MNDPTPIAPTLREAAEELAACTQGADDGPCSACLERLDVALAHDRTERDRDAYRDTCKAAQEAGTRKHEAYVRARNLLREALPAIKFVDGNAGSIENEFGDRLPFVDVAAVEAELALSGSAVETAAPTLDDLFAVLALIMASDPSPLMQSVDERVRAYADRAARANGFDGWIDAYHKIPSVP